MTTHSNVYSALAAVQQGMSGIRKDGRGNRNQYITLDHLLSVARPLCAKHGLCIVHRLDSRDGLLWVGSGVVIHDAKIGDTMVFYCNDAVWIDVPIMPQDPGSKGGASFAPWALGSAQTYGRRYGLSALFAVSSLEDDDGNKAQQTAPKQRPRRDVSARFAGIGSLIKSAKAVGRLDPSVPAQAHDAMREQKTRDIIGALVAEALDLPVKKVNTKEISDAELTRAADYWRAQRAEEDLPL